MTVVTNAKQQKITRVISGEILAVIGSLAIGYAFDARSGVPVGSSTSMEG